MTVSQYVDAGKVKIEFVQFTNSPSGNSASHIIPSPFGAVFTKRKTLVAIHAFSVGSAPTLSTATINGVTAPLLATIAQAGTATHLIGAENPTGTSGNVSFTLSGAATCRIGLWRMTRANSLAPYDSATLAFGFTSTTPQSVQIDVRGGGALWAAISDSGDNPSFASGGSYANVTEAGACEEISTTQANRTVQAAKSSGSTWQGALAALSFR